MRTSGTVDDIHSDLRRRIDLLDGADALPPGSKLPSQAALAAHYAVPTATLNRAVRRLVADGLIRTVPGSGSWVRRNAHDYKPTSRRGAIHVTDLHTAPGPDQGRCTLSIDIARARGSYPELWLDTFLPILEAQLTHARQSISDPLHLPLDVQQFPVADHCGTTRLTVITNEILIEDVVDLVDAAITQTNIDVEPHWQVQRAYESRRRRIADRRLAIATPGDYRRYVDNRIKQLPNADNAR